MNPELPLAGAASPELQLEVHNVWLDTAAQHGLELAGFDRDAPLDVRLQWALAKQLEIGVAEARYSTQVQHSTSDQVLDATRFAASHKIYLPPEFVCIDEGVSGRKVRRDGLDRAKAILQRRMATVFLVYKMSRLLRVAYRSFQFIQEEIVERGFRAISTSQGIDTKDEKTWKQLTYMHGIMDEMLLTTIADHVRIGIRGLFEQGYVTGALTVGYVGVEVPGRPTKLGKPRRAPKVNEDAAKLIRQHYEWIRDGMPIREGWRRWLKAGGPYDPRSTTKRMSYPAYRRMLSNPRYIGLWAFGRKRNKWFSKLESTRQVPQPETEVRVVISEELRIVSDELFHAVQARLAKHKGRPRGPKRRKEPQLWDLLTDCFVCDACSTAGEAVQFYQAGANGHGMRCKHGDLCRALTVIRRKTAVYGVISELQKAVDRDTDMIEQTVTVSMAMDATGDEELQRQLATVERSLARLANKISDLNELLGDGGDADRSETKNALRRAYGERPVLQEEQARLKKALRSSTLTLTPEQVRQRLAELKKLLCDGAAGKLGSDVIYKAAELFRLLVGGRIMVYVERRPGRKRTVAYGVFTPQTLVTAKRLLDDERPTGTLPVAEVRVWLRPPPKRDQLAERVHILMDIEGLSYRQAAKKLQEQGHTINSGVVWQVYRRYYEMIGQPLPPVRYNNGQPRKNRDAS